MRGEQNLELVARARLPEDKTLFAGVVSGRNVWINDLGAQPRRCSRACASRPASDVVVSTSCSLQHSPIDKRNEPRLDDEVLSWMSFAVQKLDEVATLDARAQRGRGRGLGGARREPQGARGPRAARRARATPQVRERLAQVTDADARRAEPVPDAPRGAARSGSACRSSRPRRSARSRRRPRSARRACELRKGEIDEAQYLDLMRGEIERVIRLQEEIGLDVLVHGEPERNDMVQYFAEQMDGYVFTENAWVQSATARATCGRRSSSATCRARTR